MPDPKTVRVKVSFLRRLEWCVGYDQCPLCGGADPSKMENYRRAAGNLVRFSTQDFGHRDFEHWACPFLSIFPEGEVSDADH